MSTPDARFACSPDTTYTYATSMLPPPGISDLAPNGFPTQPFPANAPKVFIDAMTVRVRVFCVEQKCAVEPELDEDDPRSWHWVMYAKDDSQPSSHGIPVSVIRIVPPPHGPHPNGYDDADEEPYCKLGRVATMKEWRGKGLSKKLIEEAMTWLGTNGKAVGSGWKGNVLAHAQVEVEKMYERTGFRTDEKLGRWDEEGIEHLGMWRRVPLN